ncbi:MAG: prolipoprotein diacylglyceryl transferase [Gemmataceae bacterium]|nr:prolipoprotein diacylglyceryl transferase [Gemmataceae bacterium]
MGQVLFWIPIHTAWTPNGVPVYGFGVMLFLAFVIGSALAARRGRLVNIPGDRLQDLILWIFIGGLFGGRLLYVWQAGVPWSAFFEIWNGGIVFYGGAIGGTVAGLLAYRRMLRPFGVTAWQVADALAPAIAMGLCLGRLGCFLNGCCYGHVAAPGYPDVHFPAMTAPARDRLVVKYAEQTLAGFSMDDAAKDDRTVGVVEAGSPAEAAGLKRGDVISKVGDTAVKSFAEIENAMAGDWPRGQTRLTLGVTRGKEELTLPPFTPRLMGLYPTQIYESITAALLILALIATWPVRKYDGQIMVLLMLGYAVHRFVNESLRDDTPVYGPFTLSQWISVGIFSAGLALAAVRRGGGRDPVAVART